MFCAQRDRSNLRSVGWTLGPLAAQLKGEVLATLPSKMLYGIERSRPGSAQVRAQPQRGEHAYQKGKDPGQCASDGCRQDRLDPSLQGEAVQHDRENGCGESVENGANAVQELDPVASQVTPITQEVGEPRADPAEFLGAQVGPV